MTNIKWISSAALALGTILLIAINVLTEVLLVGARVDLTEHHVYTLSNGTHNILKRLSEPVTLRLYVSKRMATKIPMIGPYANRVEELLGEYARLANGKIRLEIVEPESFSEAEDRAVGSGIQGIPLSNGEESTFYFGLAASGPTDERVIPFLAYDREAFLEYDITKLIHEVAWSKKPVVAIIDTLDLNPPQNPMILQQNTAQPIALEQIRQSFDVQPLEKTTDRIPENVDVLLLIQPQALTDSTCYAIDQFVMRGGKVLAFIDPMPEDSNAVPPTTDNSFAKLLAAWGVTLESGKVVGDIQLARSVQYQHNGQVLVAQYPAWIEIPQEMINNTDVVTANLGSLNLASVGALMPKTDAGTQFTPLVYSTKNAALLEAMHLRMGTDLMDVLRKFAPTGQTYTLAARINGKVTTAFPNGAPKSIPDTDAPAAEKPEPPPLPAHMAASKMAANLILVADTDLLQDRFWVQVQDLGGIKLAIPSAANGSLLVNALDNLAGDNDLINVRNRGQFSRPFNRINELRQSAERQYRVKEQELIARLEQTEQRLTDLERGKSSAEKSSDSLVLSPAQQQELENFRQDKLRIRKNLREVRHQLGKDIENLETWIKIIHIGLIPMLIAFFGVLLGLNRTRRSQKIALSSQVKHEDAIHA